MHAIERYKQEKDLLLSQFNVIDRQIKYEQNYIGAFQIKILRKRRAALRKQIDELKRKIDLLIDEPIKHRARLANKK